MSNPYGYQHKELGAAIHCLMSLVTPADERIVGAVSAFHQAFSHGTVPSGPAFQWWNKVRQIIGHDWTPERARDLTSSQRHDLVMMFWELDRAVSRDYYRVEYTGERNTQ
jgi:hypothetical protein